MHTRCFPLLVCSQHFTSPFWGKISTVGFAHGILSHLRKSGILSFSTIDSRSLHLGAIPLLLHGPFSLLVPFYAQQLFFPYLEFNISGLRCIHHLCLQILLDDFCQIASPCLLVLFGNKWRTLLSVEGVPGEWLEVEMSEEGYMLCVLFHKICFWQLFEIIHLIK